MAEAVVTNFAKDLHGTLETLISYSYFSKIDIFGELREVDRCILAIIDVLPHIEKNQSSIPMARIWLGKLTDAVLEADEIFDKITYKKLFEDLVSPRIKFLKKVSHLICSSYVHVIVLDSSTERSIVKIKQSLKDIQERIKELKIDVEQQKGKQSMSFLPDTGVFGRNELKSQIVKELLDESKSVIIAIVGLVGMGKTTLAQYVFNDTKVEKHFLDRRWWVCIANQETIDAISMKITDAATNGEQKYLLVVEDYTFGNFHIWNQLRGLLDKGAKGSKILLTTRPEEVAKTTCHISKTFVLTGLSHQAFNISKTFELTGLSDEGCLSLFNRTAFGTLQPSKEQEQIGMNLVSKCRNVPLIVNSAAKIFLEVKGKENEWLKFKDENLDIMDMCFNYNEGALLNGLRLSYELEPHLKHCFAYCSLFPKGYEFNKHDLIRMWIAQGFIKLSASRYNLEDDADKHFMDLRRMWFFQDAKCDAFGEVTSYKMHDMLHHLAKCVAGSRSVMAFSGFDEVDDRTLHVSAKVDGSFSEALFQAYKLRSLLLMKDPFAEGKLDRSTICMLISKLKCLRTLDLHDCDIDMLPNEVGDLIHLRYLDLSKNYSLITLPNSITKLYNLQTLKLNFCQKLKRLPKGIGKLIMLRYLEIDGCDNLSYMPLGLEKLSHLQTLNRFVVCLTSFDDYNSGGIKVLNTLNNLRGKLKIELSGQWKDLVDEAPQANLNRKYKLTDLKIEWRLRELDGSHNCYSYAALLEGFEPPHNLRALNIEGYRGKDFPSWARMDKLAISLPELVTISIEGCKGCKHLPLFGQLKFLKFLTLRHMEGVEYVENGTMCLSSSSTSFFPSLEELILHSFYNLKRWWKDVGELKNIGDFPSFPRLQKLKILNCPKLVSVPRLNNVEDIHFENVNEKVLEVLVLEPVSNLKRFHIKTFPYMNIFPALNIKDRCSIQNLIIDKCDTLTSLINGCERLTSLVSLEISNCKVLSFGDFPWGSLSNLQVLVFQGIPKMKSLPLGLQRINSLQSLSIVGCSALTAIPEWIDQIGSLQHLKIEACPKVTSLPLNIRYVKLDVLEISECPELIESCREPNGKCWHNIKHIREVSCHKSWRYGLMNDAMRTRILEPKLSFKDRYNNQ